MFHRQLVYQTPKVFFIALAVTAALSLQASARSASELVDKSNELLRGQSSHARVSMHIKTDRWERTLEIESWNWGRDKALMRIHAPAKERGNGTLKISKEIWNWLPAVERVIKIPPSMMHASWMGSDFTYEDVVKADSIVKDYTHKIIESKEENGLTVYQIEALPKEDAPVVWGKVLITLSEEGDNILPMKEEDYSERGDLMRVIKFSQVQEMGGRKLPTRLECLPQRKPGQKTTLTYKQFDIDVPFEKDFFGLSNLQKPIQ